MRSGVQPSAIKVKDFELPSRISLIWSDLTSQEAYFVQAPITLSKVIEYTFIIKPNDLSKIIFILISPGGMHKEEIA